MNDEERERCADELRGKLFARCDDTARRAFETYPELRSLTLLVAQFWNDEA